MNTAEKRSRRWIWTLIYLLVNVVVIAYIAIDEQDSLLQILPSLRRFKPEWLLLAVAGMWGNTFFDGVKVYTLFYSVGQPQSLWTSIRVAFMGHYYSAITPFSSGGVPIQSVYMARAGISLGRASSLLVLKFLAYQSAVLLVAGLGLIFMGGRLYSHSKFLFYATIVGFAINLALPIFLYGCAVSRSAVRKFAAWLVRTLKRMRIVKDEEKLQNTLDTYVEEMNQGIALVRSKPMLLVALFPLAILNVLSLMIVPYCIYRALGLTAFSWAQLLLLEAMLYLAISYFPVPGAVGAAEGAYYGFFRLAFPSGMLFVSTLIWRVITYYLVLAIGGLVVLLDAVRAMRKAGARKKPNDIFAPVDAGSLKRRGGDRS